MENELINHHQGPNHPYHQHQMKILIRLLGQWYDLQKMMIPLQQVILPDGLLILDSDHCLLCRLSRLFQGFLS